MYINGKEKIADPFILEITALLHDIADSKFTENIDKEYIAMAEYLHSIGISDESEHIIEIIRNISFSNKNPTGNLRDPVLLVMQDADRLDAIGAIGIARAFNYGGFRNNILYNPDDSDGESTINHFYEKLLTLRDRMNTETAKKIAMERHEFMEIYLKAFFKEWQFAG